MITRDLPMILSACLALTLGLQMVAGDRWSRQVSNSEWIPLAHPRSQFSQTPASSNQQNLVPPLNSQPENRQEYQQQLSQLHRTHDSIQKLLAIQQQLRGQQQLIQNQAYLPNAVSHGHGEKQAFHQSTINNVRDLPEIAPEILTPPRLASEALPSVYSPQQFAKSQFPTQQGQYEVVRPKVQGNRGENQYSNVENEGEKNQDNEDEVQVVYVPAETLAQRGQSSSSSQDERSRDHKQFRFPQSSQQQHFEHHSRFPQQETSVNSPRDQYDPFNSKLVQFPRGREEQDEFYKIARQKELDRLNEIRLEMQKQARLQMAKAQRDQEKQRQMEIERKQKEQETITKQREMEEWNKERVAKERQIEADRVEALERQKKQELEKLARKEENERIKKLQKQEKDSSEISTAEQFVNYQQQHLTETINPPKLSRFRNKPRTRPLNNHHYAEEQNYQQSQDTFTTPPTPNQPPLAVFMGKNDLSNNIQDVKVDDVLRTLRNAKTIAVLDQVSSEAPKVFVGPSNLELPHRYAKFDLPYLSSLDGSRVERRVDKLPFFVAPLSFTPPQGYSKIPFPAPHIGSVIINNIDSSPSVVEQFESSQKFSPKPVVESFSSGLGSSFQPSYSTTPIYTDFIRNHVTPQYQPSTGFPSTSNDRFRYRQPQYESPATHVFPNQESVSISPYKEEVTAPIHNQFTKSTQSAASVTPESYRRPTQVSSYSYEQNPVSTTPVYRDDYSHTRNQENEDREVKSDFSKINSHDYSQRRPTVNQYHQENTHFGLAQNNQFDGSVGAVQNNNGNQYQSVETPYNLPANLPPIHPQIPGLVNSLTEEKLVEQPIEAIVTTTPAPITTTTTEIPTTTYRIRTRQRNRVSTRPAITPSIATTPSTPGSTKGQAERARRPFNRSKSRFTSTTEEYGEESYEPTRSKEAESTESSVTTQYRRPVLNRNQKLNNRDRGTYESSSLNQIQNDQNEFTSVEGSSTEESSRLRDTIYSQVNSDNSGNLENTEIDYSKTPNYPRPSKIVQDSPVQNYQANVDNQPTGRITFSLRNRTFEQTSPTPISTSDNTYANNHDYTPTYAPVQSQSGEYEPAVTFESNQQTYSNPEYHFNSPKLSESNEQFNHYSSVEPPQTKTEEPITLPTTTTTTTTTTPTTTTAQTTASPAPLVIRHRVRARLGARNRQPDSSIQTQPNAGQEEYVRFGAVNQAQASTPSSRLRDSSSRSQNKTRSHQKGEIQSEGNGLVRIQSSNRSKHPKTIVQTARPKVKTTTTTTTTTTSAPLTTIEQTSHQGDAEYGFIRQPVFNQVHNQLSSRYKAPESQIQLQNIGGAADETAQDTSPTTTQVPKHRQKYQSPNRTRPALKSSANSATTIPSNIDIPTNKSQVRNDEPKNRLRIKQRRPGARKRPTTTTTTESSLDGNKLPADENYPKFPVTRTESSIERHDFNYAEHRGEAQESENSRADYFTENYPKQTFGVNYVDNSGSEEQNYPASPVRKSHRHSASGSRLKSYSNQPVEQDRDIYGAESQWSTKLTQSSFQPSNANQLGRDGEKSLSLEQPSSEASDDAPEIITAQPEHPYISVLVSSDDKHNETKKIETSDGNFVDVDSFGQKMIARDEINTAEHVESSTGLPLRKPGMRRRRVKVRRRPVTSDEFVTAETQHINSAVNSLESSLDSAKYNSHERSTQSMMTSPENIEIPTSSPVETTESPSASESIQSNDTVTINYTEIPEQPKASEEMSTISATISDDSQEKTINEDEKIPVTTESFSLEIDTTVADSPTTILPSPLPITTTTTTTTTTTEAATTKKSWDVTKGYADWFVKKPQQYYQTGLEAADDTNKQQENKNDYPKNHRTEWSEVHYPSNREAFGYARSGVLPPTSQVPGIVTKSVGDTSVKTLSDYVQAIFDTMKNADEEKTLVDGASSPPEIEAETNTSSLDLDSDEPIGEITTKNEPIEEITVTKSSSIPTTSTTPSPISEDLKTAKFLQPDFIKSSTSSSEIPTVPNTLITNQTSDISNKKSPQTKLGEILRTSTSTRVSQMTEICYRGRCVMTKPRKDSEKR